jgi:Fur family zinc uptake transcriptional regulator
MTRCSTLDLIRDAESLCEQRGKRFTPMRRRVLELILESERPVKAYDLLEALKPGAGAAKPPTVYRALDFLIGLGLVHKIEALNAYIGCAHRQDCSLSHGPGEMEFFICSQCGQVEERASLKPASDAPHGFSIERSVVEHYGRCAACAG